MNQESQTKPTIQVKIKSVYGNQLIYPACTDAEIFAHLTGKKTLSHQDLELIKTLGYEIKLNNAYGL